MLELGNVAPSFKLLDSNNSWVNLQDFIGKKVILYFYPKDDTPGCTVQAIAFKNIYDELKDKDVALLGISKDSIESHKNFIDKYDLPFTLLSDSDLSVSTAYGAYREKTVYGKKSMGIVRSTFVIDEKSIIIKIYKKAIPKTNADNIIKFLNTN